MLSVASIMIGNIFVLLGIRTLQYSAAGSRISTGTLARIVATTMNTSRHQWPKQHYHKYTGTSALAVRISVPGRDLLGGTRPFSARPATTACFAPTTPRNTLNQRRPFVFHQLFVACVAWRYVRVLIEQVCTKCILDGARIPSSGQSSRQDRHAWMRDDHVYA